MQKYADRLNKRFGPGSSRITVAVAEVLDTEGTPSIRISISGKVAKSKNWKRLEGEFVQGLDENIHAEINILNDLDEGEVINAIGTSVNVCQSGESAAACLPELLDHGLVPGSEKYRAGTKYKSRTRTLFRPSGGQQ